MLPQYTVLKISVSMCKDRHFALLTTKYCVTQRDVCIPKQSNPFHTEALHKAETISSQPSSMCPLGFLVSNWVGLLSSLLLGHRLSCSGNICLASGTSQNVAFSHQVHPRVPPAITPTYSADWIFILLFWVGFCCPDMQCPSTPYLSSLMSVPLSDEGDFGVSSNIL